MLSISGLGHHPLPFYLVLGEVVMAWHGDVPVPMKSILIVASSLLINIQFQPWLR